MPPASRLLTAQEAAAYFRMPVRSFERLRLGRVALGTAIRYDRFALDAHLDALSGLTSQSAQPGGRMLTADNDDPEAAFDRFTARVPDAARRP